MKKYLIALMTTTIVIVMATGCTPGDASKNTKAPTKVNLSGHIKGQTHFQASKHRYVMNGKVHVANKGNQSARHVYLKLNPPSHVHVTGYNDQGKLKQIKDKNKPVKIDLGHIKADQTLNKKVTLYMDGEVDKKSATLQPKLINGKHEQDIDGKIDLLVMKGKQAEISTDANGSVEQHDGDTTFDMTAEMTNKAPFGIKKTDDIYFTFKLPDGVTVEQDKLEGNDIVVDNDTVGVRIYAPGGEDEVHSFSIPISGKPTKEADAHNKDDLGLAYLNKQGKLISNGKLLTETDLDFSGVERD